MRKSYKNTKFKISAPMWYYKFELPDESYSAEDIQDYFEYIIKAHETVSDNLPKIIYVNKIENRITIKIKTRYCLKLLTPETMKLLRCTKNKIAEDKNG